MFDTFKHLKPDFNTYYAKGGGDGGAAAIANSQAEQRRWEMEQEAKREAQAKKDAAEAAAKAEAERKQNIAKSNARVNSAYNTTLGYGKTQLGTKGIGGSDFDAVMNLFRTNLDRVKSGLPEIVENANDYFTNSLFDTALSDVTSTRRTQLGKDLDSFIGDGFERSAFADTADDSILDSILGSQRSEAQAALDRALARGTINDAGYNTGKTTLGNQFKAGRAKAEDLGLGVLQGYRDQLTNEAKGYRSRLDKFNLGDNFDTNALKNTLNGLKGSLSNRMEGDIYNAIGDTNFFDTDTILGKAGNASGVTNNPLPTGGGAASSITSPLLAAFDDRQSTNTDQKKTSNGVF